ncbi:MAG: hypothetical protein JXR81_01020 [Candidatus Goldbacteria bacterium]|nr:hypothetical protein [Candidatus Goldiibacteriota bacterium]
MDTLRSKKEGAVYLKVSLPTFGKFVKQHPEIIENKKVNMKLLIKTAEKESVKKRGNIL